MRTSPTVRRLPHNKTVRAPDAGVSLVEILVVLAIIGVMAGALSLSIGSATRSADAAGLAQRLASRLSRASELTELTGTPSALIWDEGGYRFLSFDGSGWTPHPTPILGTRQEMPPGLRLATAPGETREGRQYVLTASALPAPGTPQLELVVWTEGTGPQWVVQHNGATAVARQMTDLVR